MKTSADGIGSKVVDLAEQIARRAHRGQFRRDGVTPYIQHPEAVVTRVGNGEVERAAAWLHDVIEDTSETAASLLTQGIPSSVVEVVELLTRKEELTEADYLSAIRAHPVARRVKIADMLTNLSDRPTEKQIVKYARGLLFLHESA